MTTDERRLAEKRMAAAKAAFTRAAIATLNGLPLAEAQTRNALEELEAARTALLEEPIGEQRRGEAGSATRPDLAAPASGRV